MASAAGAISFGSGVAVLILCLGGWAAFGWWTVLAIVALAGLGGAILAQPDRQAARMLADLGSDGLVTLRLRIQDHGLAVFGRDGGSIIAWSDIERVQINDDHVGLVVGGRFVVPPLPLDERHGPFVAGVLTRLDSGIR